MRKTKTVTVNDPDSRDIGKSYLLTEMGVYKAEKWAARAMLALARAGMEIPDGAPGMAALASFGTSAITHLAWEDVEPLLDEMMSCVQFVTSAGITRPLSEAQDDINELGTMLLLRKEILGLHFDFFKDAGKSS